VLGKLLRGWLPDLRPWPRPAPPPEGRFAPLPLLHDGQDTYAFPKAGRSRTTAAVLYLIHSLEESSYGFATTPELVVVDAA
jgi:hypothetical protein